MLFLLVSVPENVLEPDLKALLSIMAVRSMNAYTVFLLLLTSPNWKCKHNDEEALLRVHRASLVAREGATELKSRWKETLISGGSALPPLSHERHTWVILCTETTHTWETLCRLGSS